MRDEVQRACTYMQLQHIAQQVQGFSQKRRWSFRRRKYSLLDVALHLRNGMYLQCLSYHTITQLVVQHIGSCLVSLVALSPHNASSSSLHLPLPAHLQLFIGLQLQISTNHPTTGACTLTQPNQTPPPPPLTAARGPRARCGSPHTGDGSRCFGTRVNRPPT